MAQQLEITNFFHAKGKVNRERGEESHKRISVRPLIDLCKSPKKRGKCRPFEPGPSPRRNETISLVSSDEDQENSPKYTATPRVSAPNAPISKISEKKKTSPSKPRSGEPSNNTFFSPTKKRSVKRSPTKPRVSGSFSLTPKKLFSEDSDVYAKACAGQDDKTKFLLHIVHQYVEDKSQEYLLDASGRRLLKRYLHLHTTGARLICRLYWRKLRWYRRTELAHMCGMGKDDIVEQDVLRELMDEGFLVQGTTHNMDLEDFTDGLLKLEDFKNACKFLKIKSQTKKDAVELLQSYCKTSNNITKYFSMHQRVTNHAGNNKERVLKLLREAAGECYRLADACRETLHRLHVLSYLGMDPDVLRSKQLELQLLNVKSKRESFPLDPHTQLDKPTLVFPSRESFKNYMVAHYIYEEFLQSTESAKKISLVRQAHNKYKNLRIEEFRPLAPWLRRFTPAYLYIKTMEDGLPELKKGKDEALCRQAVDMLSCLLAQDMFRRHRRAGWYDEKALVLHHYLHLPDQAAAVVVEALSSELPEEEKDLIRPRARKLAGQKNIQLEEKIRSVLLAYATKDYILETSLPSTHFYKPAMDNTTKGKVRFESKTEDGRTISSVENVAITSYIETGEYTHGRHWEGRIVTTLFFLLFWDIIYTKPENVEGIFLSHYQRYPLDMFCDTFYQSRKEAIDDRLKHIETSSVDVIVQMMSDTWTSRPEGERGGLSRDLGWDALAQVARCLGAAPLAALCRRLALHYKYACSGFPDLTLWHVDTGKIKFVEVKSDSDKPSMKQIQWMQYLLANGLDTEFCYVGTRGLHAAVRTSALKLLQQL